jgi:signal transduction histidine kinase
MDVLIAVHDSGPRLQPQSRDRLFEGFHTAKPHGLGMGLTVCRSIVEQHGGFIGAPRKAGPGATIQITLPVEGTAHQVA